MINGPNILQCINSFVPINFSLANLQGYGKSIFCCFPMLISNYFEEYKRMGNQKLNLNLIL